MDLTKIKEQIENQFVDDYEQIKEFMDDVNNTLTKLEISGIYNSYNDFCKDIEKYILQILNENNEEEVSPDLIIVALNNMVKCKILEDNDYENKIKNHFNEDFVDDIKKVRKHNSK